MSKISCASQFGVLASVFRAGAKRRVRLPALSCGLCTAGCDPYLGWALHGLQAGWGWAMPALLGWGREALAASPRVCVGTAACSDHGPCPCASTSHVLHRSSGAAAATDLTVATEQASSCRQAANVLSCRGWYK